VFSKGQIKLTNDLKSSLYFKTIAYLLKPSDNPHADIYIKDRKISSSSMAIASILKVKNYLNYSFIIDVRDSLSTLVFMSAHHSTKLNYTHDENEIIIYGKGKTWILIEKID